MFKLNKRLTIAILCCTLIIGVFIAMVYTQSLNKSWKSFEENENYNNFSNGEILSISLQKSFVTKIVFSDDDLISMWNKFFDSLEIRKHRKRISNDKNMDGGGEYVEVETSDSNYSFSFIIPYSENQVMLLIDDYYYEFQSNVENPFNDTYDIAKERHTEINLWE